ncbi:MAG: hypothetical protein V2A79_06905, partial [Planctomycetota bacterium]
RITLFEACSAFTRVTACMLAESSKTTLSIEGSDDFVTSIAAPIATGWFTLPPWSRSPPCRVGLSPTEDARLFTAH